MSDGAAGGAPGGAAPAGGATGAPPSTTAPAAKAEPKKAPAPKAPEGGSEWSDADDADLFTKLQKAPWAKVKANGEEKRITSREDFLALATDASRSRGMNKMAEETKKQQAEAKAAREEHEQHKALLDRARRGDQRALRELGLVPDNERAELERQWQEMTPEQQALHQRNHELETRLAERERRDAEAQHAETEKAKKLQRDKVMEKAKAHLGVILKDVKAELHDVELPEVIAAMRSLTEAGQRLGRDYDETQLAAYVQGRRAATLDSRVQAMKPEAALRLAVPHLKALISTPEGMAQLEEVLGVDFELVAGKLSGRRLEKYRASKTKAALKPPPQQQERREKELDREPLSPFRYKG